MSVLRKPYVFWELAQNAEEENMDKNTLWVYSASSLNSVVVRSSTHSTSMREIWLRITSVNRQASNQIQLYLWSSTLTTFRQKHSSEFSPILLNLLIKWGRKLFKHFSSLIFTSFIIVFFFSFLCFGSMISSAASFKILSRKTLLKISSAYTQPAHQIALQLKVRRIALWYRKNG